MLDLHTLAPDFELSSALDKRIKLSSLTGKKVILVFYPADWSPVCTDQLALYNETLRLFAKHNIQLLGISTDSKWCHAAFSQQRNLHFPLLADFEPKGEVARKFGVYDEVEGTAKRALVIIDEKGTVAWSFLSPPDVNPGADGILLALEKLDGHKSKKLWEQL